MLSLKDLSRIQVPGVSLGQGDSALEEQSRRSDWETRHKTIKRRQSPGSGGKEIMNSLGSLLRQPESKGVYIIERVRILASFLSRKK